ncbi:hypothetical protein GCM10022415_08590 [Knoellia locipacati]|uniref:Uncharacterized protein n=1 Tax=Knoellia locipacati TaxID=882824 RepID=A0A512SXX6_9MICO|nr:hypothetical protein [Knoellia locipacati]GEQ12810.1 hypothetical protein KLO01_08570 [Knoellia locipacati]
MTVAIDPSPVPTAPRVARRWSVGVLALATVVLAAYLALVVVAAWLVGSTIEAIAARDVGSVDVGGLAVSTIPGLVGGWGVGLGAAALLARGEAVAARAVGVTAGLLGVVVGAVVLAVTGVL